MPKTRESVNVLQECIDLQIKKSADYQNPNSNIKQAMHYRRGISSIHDMIAQKLLRAQSLIEPMENGEARTPNFESLEDTYKDLINYASFAVSYIRGKMEGQDTSRDMFNRAKPDVSAILKKAEEAIDEIIREHIVEDVSGGSATGQVEVDGYVALNEPEVEADGFITVIPSLFVERGKDTKEIKLNPDRKNSSLEERLQAAYFREIADKGEVVKPRGVVNCTDNLQHAYVNRVVKDVGDRIDEDFREHVERKYD